MIPWKYMVNTSSMKILPNNYYGGQLYESENWRLLILMEDKLL